MGYTLDLRIHTRIFFFIYHKVISQDEVNERGPVIFSVADFSLRTRLTRRPSPSAFRQLPHVEKRVFAHRGQLRAPDAETKPAAEKASNGRSRKAQVWPSNLDGRDTVVSFRRKAQVWPSNLGGRDIAVSFGHNGRIRTTHAFPRANADLPMDIRVREAYFAVLLRRTDSPGPEREAHDGFIPEVTCHTIQSSARKERRRSRWLLSNPLPLSSCVCLPACLPACLPHQHVWRVQVDRVDGAAVGGYLDRQRPVTPHRARSKRALPRRRQAAATKKVTGRKKATLTLNVKAGETCYTKIRAAAPNVPLSARRKKALPNPALAPLACLRLWEQHKTIVMVWTFQLRGAYAPPPPGPADSHFLCVSKTRRCPVEYAATTVPSRAQRAVAGLLFRWQQGHGSGRRRARRRGRPRPFRRRSRCRCRCRWVVAVAVVLHLHRGNFVLGHHNDIRRPDGAISVF